MNDQKIGLKALLRKFQAGLHKYRRYGLAAFLIFVGIIYGFVFLRISALQNIQPSSNDVNNKVQGARIPHIDESIVRQLKSLQDNSVSVKALFDEARSNPFQ